jgi:thiamine-monophosphate kinase
VLSRGFRSPRILVDAHRRPAPPYAEGPRAAALGATAMTDVSDGLLADLGHIALASGVLVEVSSDAFHVPQEFQDTARALNADPMAWLLTGGDDHALVATFPPDVDLPMAWSVVGRVVEGEGVLVDGQPYGGAGGWQSFE